MTAALLVWFSALAVILGVGSASANPPSNAIRFLHDADGRLRAVIEPEGESAYYGWDSVGNLLAIVRHPTGKLSVAQMSPARGEVGAVVKIEGTGFSTNTSADTVKFAGTVASVTAATAYSLTVKVPAGATSGSVTVATPGEGPVSSPESFSVVESAAPQITSISPTVAVTGQEVSVTGSNFSSSIPVDALTMNLTRPEIISASSSSIKFKVPEGALGAHVSLTTGDGSVVGPDLFVPPAGAAASTVGYTGRFALGESKTVTFAGSKKTGLLLFDGLKGRRLVFSMSESTVTGGTVSVWSPRGKEIATATFTKSAGGYIDETAPLPLTGTYTVLVTPSTTSTGSVKIGSYEFPESTGTIVPKATAEGVTQHVAIPNKGQAARFSVTMAAGERLALRTENSNFTGSYAISWLGPKGETVSTETFGPKENWFWDTQTFATPGVYKLLVDPYGAATGSVDLRLWEDPDVSGGSLTPSATGASKTLSITVPGQRGVITFTGTEGQKVSLVASETSMEGQFSLLAPSGNPVEGSSASLGEPIDGPLVLPEAGTYKIVVDPTAEVTGSVKVTAYSAADVTGTITPKATAEGASQAVSLPTPGQVARYSVAMSAGEKVALKTTGSAFSGIYYLRWLNPAGEVVAQESFNGTENYFWDPTTFAAAGTYTLVVDPEAAATGSVDLRLWEDPDVSGGSLTPSATGASKTLSITVPGQRGVITFTGTKNQTLTVKAVESTIAEGRLAILKSTGEGVTETTFSSSAAGRVEFKVPAAGTYTIVLDPTADQTGSVKAIAYTGSHVAFLSPLVQETQMVSLDLPGGGGPAPVSSGPESELSTLGLAGSSVPIALSRHEAPQRDFGHPDRPRRSRSSRQTSATQVGPHFDPSTPALWSPPRTSHVGRGWVSGAPPTPWEELPPRQAERGQTALTGQVLEQNGTPLAGIRVGIAGSAVVARTDGSGRFLLSGVPPGHQVLVVDGETEGRRFGIYEVGADIEDHQTTSLDSPVWLTALDPAGDRSISSPTKRETTLTDPEVPGLEVELPKGTVIRDAAGRPITELNISAVPVDRTPAPLPTFQTIPLYYTIQPGRAYLSKGARIIYPNWSHLPPSQRVSFWNYDAHGRGWFVYGEGSVSADGSQIVPDPGVRVWKFSGAMISATQGPPEEEPNEEEEGGGDPVDYHSGLFTYRKNDLVLPDTIPVVVARTYRPKDPDSYSFGQGTQSYYDMHLWSENNYQECDLVLPSGSRVHYKRVSEGTGYTDAVYRWKLLLAPSSGPKSPGMPRRSVGT